MNGRTLSQDLRSLVFLVSGTALLLAAAVWLLYQALALYSSGVDNLASDARSFAGAVSAAVASGDRSRLTNLLEGLSRGDGIQVAAVYAADGTLLDKAAAEGQNVVPISYTGPDGSHLDGAELVHAVSLTHGGNKVGVLYLRSTLRKQIQQFLANVIVGALVISAAFGIALYFAMRAQKRIAEPIDGLINTVRSASASNDYSLRADYPSAERREVAELIDAFNSLLEKVDGSNRRLEQTTQYYLSLINRAADVMLVLDADGRVKFANNVLEKLLGYRSQDLVGQDPSQYARPGDCDTLRRAIGEHRLGDGETMSFEMHLKHKRGDWRSHLTTATNLLHDPAVQGIVLHSRDVSEQKAIEEESRANREFLDAVFENIPNMIFVKDAQNLRFVRMNKAAESLLGYKREELLGKNDFDFFPEEQAEFFSQMDRRVLDSGEALDIEEEPIETRHQGERILHTKKVPIYDEDGKALYLLGISEDVTHLRDAMDAVQASEERYRSVVENAADAFFVHDLSGRFIDANRQACVSLGYTRKELLSMNVSDIEMRFDAERVKETWDAITRGRLFSTVQGEHKRKDGTTFPVEVRLAKINFASGDAIIALARDVTQRQQTEIELLAAKDAAEAANRVKTQFLANMSHEIRTPMNAVIGITDLLLHTALTKRQCGYVKTIRTSGDLLLNVIDDVLDFAKLDAGMSLRMREFDLDDVVEAVVDILGYEAHQKGIELVCRCEVCIPLFRVTGDPDRLRQVLLNLVGNAVKFTEQGQVMLEVSIEVETTETILVRFSVADSGIGFDDQVKHEIFSPFTQLDFSTTRRHRGTGLGLSISKRLIEMMGGAIDVESKPGIGSVFWFTVPFEKSDIQPRPLTEITGKRVLVADRNEVVAETLVAQLTALGMRAQSVSDSDQLMKTLVASGADDPYEFALIDAELSPTDGLAMAGRIRADARVARTNIVVMPSIARPLEPGMISSITGVRCLSKPLLPRALRDTLIEFVSDEPAGADSASLIQPKTLENLPLRVLIAEDNVASREVLLEMLRILGCSADAVGDGLAAVEALDKTQYDALLLDCQMPGMDGYEVSAQIRRKENQQREDAHKTIIIAVTAHASTEDEQRCKEAGVDAYLSKPVRLPTIRRALCDWFGDRAVQDAHSDVPINHAALDAIRNDTALMDRLMHLFLEDAETRLANMGRMVSAASLDELPRAAHALRAGCLQVGAEAMAELCDELKQVDSADTAKFVLDCIAKEFERVRNFLEGSISVN